MGGMSERLVVAGHGMVGHRLVEAMVERDLLGRWEVVVVGEEARPAYDRVHLSSLFDGSDPPALTLAPLPGVDLRLGATVTTVDRARGLVRTSTGEAISYDRLVLATGSRPFVPPIAGTDAAGSYVYRTIDDVEAIGAWATSGGCGRGIVVGGGLLGLEAANALRNLGLETHVVEFAPRLMSVQLDEAGARMLRRHVEALGIVVHTSAQAAEVRVEDGVVAGLTFADGGSLDGDVVVFAAGVRPRDELARDCGLEVGDRGGIVVDDRLTTSDPRVMAIGECALHRGRLYGLVAPGYAMATVVAERLGGGDATFEGADLSTQLKLLGVDVATFGDSHGVSDGAQEVVTSDATSGVYKKLVLSADGAKVLGGVLVGDAGDYSVLLQMVRGTIPTPAHPERLLLGSPDGAPAGLAPGQLPDGAGLCSCHNVSTGAVRDAIRDGDLCDVASVKSCTKAGTGCGSCLPLLKQVLDAELVRSGREVTNHLCEHFAFSRQELFDLVRLHRIRSFRQLVTEHGRGHGCEICKPAVASMLASMGNGYILDGEQAALQDTNDHFLANLQRDGTYSVVPRVPGGEIRPEQLIVIGEIARDFDLYTKITGGQRIDLFGARVDQLPEIWRRLVDAGFESGHAYGKAVRTVKSCVGSTWCRYGVQDAVGLAVDLELRYRGLRAPHKLKLAVSGCARECAEAQGKDVGVIATENGWNLYVAGNGGMRPQHALLLAGDLDTETLIRYVDRFLMFYVRTADRLERTATWFNKLNGGIDHLRAVVIEDSLGICAELEADMARHVDTYECEWKATLDRPERLARFRHFVNVEGPDPSLAYDRERGQRVPVELGRKVVT